MPPDVKLTWEENGVWGQAQLIAYNEVREIEDAVKENEKLAVMAGVSLK